MAKTYKVTPVIRFFNSLMKLLVRFGLGPSQIYIMSVPGRKSGKLYSTPVSLVIEPPDRWLVAPYGEVSWVRNARAAGQVSLTRGRRSETVSIRELDPQKRAPILKKYLQMESFPRPYFEAKPDSPLEVFEAEAAKHPVFRIENSIEASA